jgi:hypothetical protein
VALKPTEGIVNVSASLTLAAIGVLLATPAYAYVDPGTGGMLVQLITGGVAGLLVLGRLYWRRGKEILTGKPTPETPPTASKQPPAPPADPR